jgi:hypothetical protein
MERFPTFVNSQALHFFKMKKSLHSSVPYTLSIFEKALHSRGSESVGTGGGLPGQAGAFPRAHCGFPPSFK